MAKPCLPRNDRPSLRDLVAHPEYVSRVSEITQRVPQAADEVEALELLKEAACRMGADSAAFGSFVRDDPSHESYRFLLACDPVWCLEYSSRVWYAHDPWLNYALRNSEPTPASFIPAHTKEERSIVALAEE